MKRKGLLLLIPMAMTAIVASGLLNKSNARSTEASDSEFESTKLDVVENEGIVLKDCTDNEIISYYSGLNGKTSSELQGTNLLKNLKGIITNNIRYFSYSSSVHDIYTITDRDWKNSPVSSLSGTYDPDTQTLTGFSHSSEAEENPYLHLLYCDYDVKPTTRYNYDGDVSDSGKSFDKEHAWSQSHGFDNGTTSGANLTGAGSDLHHLKAGTQYGNRTLHSNYSYGFVKTNDWDTTTKPYEHNNKRGEPLFAHAGDQQNKVFEPQDCDKGDIARSLLYMVAAYNNYDGSTPTGANPALQLVNYVISENTTGYSKDNIQNGYYGILQDILAWHHMDPVDEYEIHRNNLIYRNYQHNRNPFIDFPQWVDYIWGTSEYNANTKTINYNSTPTGSANLLRDVINGYRPAIDKEVVSIAVTTQPTHVNDYHIGDYFDSTGMVVTATFDDDSQADVTSYCAFTVDTSSAGVKTVTVKCVDVQTTLQITVLPDPTVTSITLNKNSDSIDLKDGNTVLLEPTVVGTNSPRQKAYWTSSNTRFASVEDGVVTCKKPGTVTITAAAYDDTSKTATCTITITDTRESGSSETVTIGKDDYTAGYADAGTSGSISKTIVEDNDLTINYSGINTQSKTGLAYSYTMYLQNKGFIYSNNAIDGYYPSRISVVFDSGVSASAVVGAKFTSEKSDSLNSDISYKPKENECQYVISNEDDTLLYWNFSTKAYNTRVLSIDVTYTTIGGTGAPVDVTGVSLNRNEVELSVGDTTTLIPTVSPVDATNQNISWYSDDISVASINDEGVVTANGAGTATITVTTEDGEYTDTCEITVLDASGNISQVLTLTTTDFITHSGAGSDDNWSKGYVSGSGDILSFAQAIRMNNSATSRIYSTTKLRGYITNITLTAYDAGDMSTGVNLNVYASATSIAWASGTPEGGQTETLSTSSQISIDYNVSDHLTYFGIKSLANNTYIESISVTYDTTEYLASQWAISFKDAMNSVCDQVHGNTNLTNLTNSWNSVKDTYIALDSTIKELILDSSAVYDTGYKADIDAAISSYTYIAEKYSSLTPFITGIEINQSFNQHSALNPASNDTLVTILLIGTMGMFTVTLLILVKKKQR